ncbi:DUF2079 domain-containing protein [Kocuria sp. cx-116]|uniref:DUF2079 domain-containing protein n=1 Tax=Kocuria sp. cx-116 TaxID=2771378 RepID=UPI002A4E1B8A|nr:DUF2079 domain-containing protein [Kocuria sp. cx-116]
MSAALEYSASPTAVFFGRNSGVRGRRRWWPVGMGVAFTLLYTLLSLTQWHQWEVPSWDNAIFTQLLKSYAAGQPPVANIKGHDFILLGDHFHPLLAVLAPAYWLFPSALALMILQDVLLGWSVGVVSWCAARALRPAPAGALSVAYGLSFGLQSAVAVQFHEVALAVPLLALSLCALRQRRWPSAVLWAAPVALVKEDLGMTVAAVGAVMVGHAFLPTARASVRWLHRVFEPPGRAAGGGPAASSAKEFATALSRTSQQPAVLGALLMAWGIGLSLLAVWVILPGLNPHGAFAYADTLDVAGALRDPTGAVITMFVPDQKLGTWLLTLAAGAVVAVRSPLALVALPTLAWRMLSPNHGYWGPGWHYNAVIMPIVFIAVIDAVVRLRAGGTRSRTARATAELAPWVVLVVALAVATQQPLAQLVTGEAWRQDPRADIKAATVQAVPEGASVATDLTLINGLVSRADVHWIGNADDPAPDFVVIDRESGTWGQNPPEDPAAYAQELYGEQYATQRDEGNIILLRRESP